ncbi:MAG: tetratricopeptide repeat protein [Lentisphaerae bacterium]|nr:tetratricopeptide repeat protein [Lentisphaerota bacterium]
MRKSAWPFWGVTVILLATLAAFAPAVQANFLNLDDYRYLTAVRPFDAARITYIFTHYFEGYHPLTLVSLGLTFRLAGFDPWMHHAVNILLHLVNTVLVYLLATRLLRDRVAATVTCAVFGLHPIHVEAVAWVTSRKDLLYACFYLAGLLSYISAVTHGGRARHARTILCFLLACLSKGMAVSFPLALLAVDVALQRPITWRTLVLEKLPYWAGALGLGWLSIRAQQASGYVPNLADAGNGLTRASRALACLWLYAAHFFQVPAITAFHPFPAAAELRRESMGGGALLLCGVAFVAWARRRRPPAAFACMFFFAGIVLVLQVIPVADFIVADRYAYVSSIGLCALVGLGVARLCLVPRRRAIALGLAAAYSLTLALGTHAYAHAWRNSDSLWSHVLARHPDAVFPLNMRGCARNDLGRYADAIADFDRAAALNPAYVRTYLNRGFAREKLGDQDGALADYERVCRLDPANALGHNNRGLALLHAGQRQAAHAAFDEAIRLAPHNPQAHLFFGNRAETCLAEGDAPGAIADATAAIARFPRHFRAYLTRAVAHWTLGETTAAAADLSQARAIDPYDPQVAALGQAWGLELR